MLAGFTMPFDVEHVAVGSLWSFLTTDPPIRPERRLDELQRVYDTWIDMAVGQAHSPAEARSGVGVVELPTADRFNLMITVDDEEGAERVLATVKSVEGVEEVLQDDRESLLVRAAPGAVTEVAEHLRRVLGVRPS
jgi:hypothetical protein